MQTKLSLRSRRVSTTSNETFHHFIAFLIGEDFFAFPIDKVVKIVPLGQVYGENKGTEIGLTTYQDQEIPVINLAQILGKKQINATPSQFAYLMILQLDNRMVGLSLTSSPKVHRVPDSNLVPLPEMYLSQQNFPLFTGKMAKLDEHSPILILDAQKLSFLLS
ncbi:MAG: chemotaxis protein CheW [Microcystaceae cyanobacterium]